MPLPLLPLPLPPFLRESAALDRTIVAAETGSKSTDEGELPPRRCDESTVLAPPMTAQRHAAKSNVAVSFMVVGASYGGPWRVWRCWWWCWWWSGGLSACLVTRLIN